MLAFSRINGLATSQWKIPKKNESQQEISQNSGDDNEPRALEESGKCEARVDDHNHLAVVCGVARRVDERNDMTGIVTGNVPRDPRC